MGRALHSKPSATWPFELRLQGAGSYVQGYTLLLRHALGKLHSFFNDVDEIEILEEETACEQLPDDIMELVQGGDPYENRRIDGCARSVRY